MAHRKTARLALVSNAARRKMACHVLVKSSCSPSTAMKSKATKATATKATAKPKTARRACRSKKFMPKHVGVNPEFGLPVRPVI